MIVPFLVTPDTLAHLILGTNAVPLLTEILPNHILLSPFQEILPCRRQDVVTQSVNLIQAGKDRSSRPEVFCKKGGLRNFATFTRKHLCQSLFFKKETLVQVFSCEFCEISKNTFSYRTHPVTASVHHQYKSSMSHVF